MNQHLSLRFGLKDFSALLLYISAFLFLLKDFCNEVSFVNCNDLLYIVVMKFVWKL
jgi:hypothetical protein